MMQASAKLSDSPEVGAFLEAIQADQDDPGPWRIFADWLDEQGDGELAEGCRVIALAVESNHRPWLDEEVPVRHDCRRVAQGRNYDRRTANEPLEDEPLVQIRFVWFLWNHRDMARWNGYDLGMLACHGCQPYGAHTEWIHQEVSRLLVDTPRYQNTWSQAARIVLAADSW